MQLNNPWLVQIAMLPVRRPKTSDEARDEATRSRHIANKVGNTALLNQYVRAIADETDKKLLAASRKHGAQRAHVLANMLKCSPDTIRNSSRRLIQAGVMSFEVRGNVRYFKAL